MKRYAILTAGALAYVLFLGVVLYAVGFVGNVAVPTRLDGTPRVPMLTALVIDLFLLALFAVQHSVMARPWFKARWTRIVPAPLERSVYVVSTNLVLMLLFWQWQPIGGTIWNVEVAWGRTLLYALFAAGWLTVLVTTFLINHFDLFGLRQVWLYFRGRPYTPLGFVTPGPYRWVRHPMYIGWLLAFWATPTMTTAHLAFALAITVYILAAIRWEERDLVASLGPSYANYQRTVPKFIPKVLPRRSQASPATPDSVIETQRGRDDSTVFTTAVGK